MTNIKVVEKISLKPGKNVILIAGVHGNEVCGVRAFDKLIPNIKVNSGKVIFIYANLEAISQNKRFVEYNLNRCFLKKQSNEIYGSLEGQTAREIMPYLDKADVLLDIHASFSKDSVPFVICDESQMEKAEIFDSDRVVCNFDPFEPGATEAYLSHQNKVAFGFECGYLGDTKTQEVAEEAINNFLIFTGNVKGNLKKRKNQMKFRIKSLYKNKNFSFKKEREFADFEEVNSRMLIGREGNKEIYAEKGDILLFVRDRDKINEECFLIAEKIK